MTGLPVLPHERADHRQGPERLDVQVCGGCRHLGWLKFDSTTGTRVCCHPRRPPMALIPKTPGVGYLTPDSCPFLAGPRAAGIFRPPGVRIRLACDGSLCIEEP